MGPYLDKRTEQELQLEFERPGSRDLDALKDDLKRAADWLGAEPGELNVPQRGFLTKKLNDVQIKEINSRLATEYAEVNEAHRVRLKKVPINEGKDRMVSIAEAVRHAGVSISFSDAEFHEACGTYARGKRIWFVRQQVMNNLITVFKAFNQIGIKPHLEDGYRPPEVQQGLLLRRMIDTAREYPDHDWKEVRKIAMSLTAPSPGLAGHQAGAALDMTLRNLHTDRPLELGNEYAKGGVNCCINFPYVTREQFETRMKFAHIMRMGKFKLLPTEDWHASFGDRGMGIDGPVNIHQAIYGPITGFNMESGKVTPYKPGTIEEKYLDYEATQKLVNIARIRSEKSYQLTQTEVLGRFREHQAAKFRARNGS